MRIRFAIAILAAAALWAERAAAETPPAAADDDEARRLYESGRRHYVQHEYDEALTDLKASYERVQVAALLYDLAQVYRLKGDCAEALRLYRDYLASGAGEHVRERTQARIAEMSSCVARQQEAARAQQVPAAPLKPALNLAAASPGNAVEATVVSVAPPPSPPRAAWSEHLFHSPTALAMAATTVVLASLCGYFAWQTADASDEVSNAFRPGTEWSADRESAQQRGHRSEKLSLASGAGAVLAGAATTWLTLRY